MKNIHLVPTDNYAPLVRSANKYGELFNSLHYSPMKDLGDSYQHLYVISNEEIKEGDWGLSKLNEVVKFGKKFTTSLYSKIILTTDPKLIADGVQQIDKNFIDWFVANPSCEEVEVKRGYLGMGRFVETNEPLSKDKIEYKLIIPEEPIKPFMDERREAIAWFNAKDDLDKSELCFIYYGTINYNNFKSLTGRQIENIWKGENGEITLQYIDEQVSFTEKRGEKIVQYLKKYEGQSIYNEIALAIEFGYQIKQEEEDEEQKIY